MPDESKIRDVADAARGVLEAVPVYQDTIQPLARQVGVALETVGKAINLALAPIGALVWGYDKIKEWMLPALEARLANVPAEQIVTPPPNIAGPVIEALRFAGTEGSLRDLYANLLATAMDADTAQKAHPAFVEFISQLTPDEAKLLAYIATLRPDERVVVTVRGIALNIGRPHTEPRASFEWLTRFSTLGERAGCVAPGLSASYLDNLERLGLIVVDMTRHWSGRVAEREYAALEAHPDVQNIVRSIGRTGKQHPDPIRGVIVITALGEQFIAACVVDRSAEPESVTVVEPAES